MREQGGRVLLADDHPLTREGLAMAARLGLAGVIVDTAGTVREALDALERHRSYRMILLDFMLPDARGFSGLLQLQHRAGDVPIVMITANQDPVLVDAARALGAAGFLWKTEPLDLLAGKLRMIDSGQPVFPPTSIDAGDAAARARQLHTAMADLTAGQRKVLLALADGRLNKQIAGDLGISEATVKAHLTAVFRKLKVTNRAQALLALQPLLGRIAEGVEA